MDDQFIGLRIPTLELVASCTVMSSTSMYLSDVSCMNLSMYLAMK